ncbi:MAG: MFS transporter [Candidatus Pacebacteria bacterium]|nr:MFS transporter [Candidatus Paceibacterota bacterium]
MSTTDGHFGAQCPPAEQAAPDFPVVLLAVGAGIGVANVYYSQPILHLVERQFQAGPEQAGLVATLTQIGYGVGLLLLAPLGDLTDRKRLIAAKALLLALALAASALAPTLPVLIASGVAIGLLGSVGQDFISLAAQLAPEARRGWTVGTVMTGFLIGILCSRTLGGFIAEFFGWRSVFWGAVVLIGVVALAAWRLLPAVAPAARGTYIGLLGGLWELVKNRAVLRKSMMTQALIAGSLGAFWSTLAMMLAEPPFALGAGLAGVFGLAGAAGALAAPLFGHLADRSGPMVPIRAGCLLVVAAFGLMPLVPGSLWVLGIGAVLFDLGVMASMISHQAIINGLDASARSRLNGLLVTAAMAGVAAGTWVGNWAFAQFGWNGVCAVGIFAGASALARSLIR